MPEISFEEWNQLIHDHPKTHLLQTGAWGELKSAFGWEPVRLVGQGLGAQLLFRHLPLGLTFAYLPKGPIILHPKSENHADFWGEVDLFCKNRRAIFLKVEPDGWENEDMFPPLPLGGFHLSSLHVQPRSTLVIDLRRSQDEVFNCMKPKTRYNIRLAGRKGVTIRISDDIGKFHQLMNVTSHREAFHVHSLEYYQRAYNLFHPLGQCELFFAENQERILAGLMVFAFGDSAYYLYGASADVERNRKPTYPLQWEAICWAQAKGCLEYDMWGIPDDASGTREEEQEEREDGLWGVYRFKRGFGGVVKHAFHAYDRIYNPLLYKLYLWRFSGSGSD